MHLRFKFDVHYLLLHTELINIFVKLINAPKNKMFELSEVSPADLRKSSLLPSFCKLILDVGNFLNYVRITIYKVTIKEIFIKAI